MIAPEMRRSGIVLVAASAVVALGLVGVVAVDYAATRRELLGLLRAHAGALRETVAAAARSNRPGPSPRPSWPSGSGTRHASSPSAIAKAA